MRRRLWILLGWSPAHGVPATVVAVLGLDAEDNRAVAVHVEWMPREYTAGRTWRARLAATSADDLLVRMSEWEDSPIAPAVVAEPSARAADVAAAVQIQLDDLLRPPR
ncbi:hypothetical protein [Amycolatopsis samaneae]|uniref:Uncharacterized protein n=1 Tax=Amycolatopsis samaneae TaxID=664691 RepID=A0ABW5GYE4_9PSEU